MLGQSLPGSRGHGRRPGRLRGRGRQGRPCRPQLAERQLRARGALRERRLRPLHLPGPHQFGVRPPGDVGAGTPDAVGRPEPLLLLSAVSHSRPGGAIGRQLGQRLGPHRFQGERGRHQLLRRRLPDLSHHGRPDNTPIQHRGLPHLSQDPHGHGRHGSLHGTGGAQAEKRRGPA